MALSYTQKSNDTSFISTYSALIDQWTQYLISNTLVPANQYSSDAFAGSLANQTNLAIKGIIGIQAAAEIMKLLGDEQKSQNYSSIASSYMSQWQDMACSSDKSHLTLSYGDNPSWGLMYNLYADKLLGTNLFPDSIYEMQTNWYSTQKTQYGIALDSRNNYTKSDWQIWTAGTVTDWTLRDSMINLVKNYVADGLNNAPLPDWYDVTGTQKTLTDRPVVGGHLALLALGSSMGSAPSGNSNSSSGTPGGDPTHNSATWGRQMPLTLCIVLVALGILVQY